LNLYDKQRCLLKPEGDFVTMSNSSCNLIPAFLRISLRVCEAPAR
jgi:hypothetical protein